jgi:hypothetical protein
MSTTKCGHTVPCGCADVALTTPAPCTPVGCPDPYPCSEITNAECVIYTGNPIICDNTTLVNQDTNVADALNNIVEYFCDNAGGADVVVAAGTGIDVSSTTVGNTTTYTVTLEPVVAKAIQYLQNVQGINVSTMPTPSVYGFPSVGYATLTYTNPTSTVKVYKVYGSYDTNSETISPNNPGIGNWVDGAIIKTITGIDSILWESLGAMSLSGFLLWGPNPGDTIGSGIPIHLLPDNQGSNVNFRFLIGSFPRNVSFFQLVTLNPGESVSLKFKTKDLSSPSNLLAAQLLVEEV